ncbi:hypothetical protein GX50_04370 [[Emmonsia] crescens]|uniref:Uncharacterized protein n=1 Tax=[Emmonsia] crescens TaxID=73230 RepID=A0A2B7ZHM4_9EURO|nr:hypothetical protein GX50_04370 [Emmonsia crescens]
MKNQHTNGNDMRSIRPFLREAGFIETARYALESGAVHHFYQAIFRRITNSAPWRSSSLKILTSDVQYVTRNLVGTTPVPLTADQPLRVAQSNSVDGADERLRSTINHLFPNLSLDGRNVILRVLEATTILIGGDNVWYSILLLN